MTRHLHFYIPEEAEHLLPKWNRYRRMLQRNVLTACLRLVQQEGRIRSSRFEGSVQEVLVEEESREKGIFTGRTEYNLLVHFPGTADLLGKYVKVSLDECHGFYYMGSLVEE